MRATRAWVLIAAAAWTIFVWVSRILIMARQDSSTGFKVVHFALAGISIAFAVAIGRIGLLLRREALAAPAPVKETASV